MRESLNDLNSLLFEELERLGNADLSGENLDEELRRAAGMAKISTNIINTANVAIQAVRLQQEHVGEFEMPSMLLGSGDEKA